MIYGRAGLELLEAFDNSHYKYWQGQISVFHWGGDCTHPYMLIFLIHKYHDENPNLC